MDHAYRPRQGRFYPAWHDEPAAFIGDDGALTLLEDSLDAFDLFELGGDLALGANSVWQSYDAACVQLGYMPGARAFPMALWNVRTGALTQVLRGHQCARCRGAQRLDDQRLITWHSDFLIRLWDRRSGALLETMPMPAPLHASGTPIVRSYAFSDLSDAARADYVATREGPAFTIRQRVLSCDDSERRFGPIVGSPATGVRRFDEADAPFADVTTELRGVTGGYATVHRLADGRWVFGGTTYGVSQHFYVWDGALALTIFTCAEQGGASFEIDGEVAPNAIQVRDIRQGGVAWRYVFQDV